jgi:opacity protein-like surface antigen
MKSSTGVESECQSNSTVGSAVAWQVSAALGCEITRYIFLEVGYRFLYDNSHDTNFLDQVAIHGAQITISLNF